MIYEEDVHFYLDYSPYEQVTNCLKAMNNDSFLSISDVNQYLGVDYRSEVFRRLLILGLTEKYQNGNLLTYKLTGRGQKVQDIMFYDEEILPDVMHYLHMMYEYGNPASCKMLWSYRTCCELTWNNGKLFSHDQLASSIQALMKEEFPNLNFMAKEGARFDSTAVGRWLSWMRVLIPNPFPENSNTFQFRETTRYQLILLAIDDLYRRKQFRYGDPVIVGETILDDIASVFFLTTECTMNLIKLAAKFSSVLSVRDTFGGMSITLKEAYGVERI